MNLLSNKRLESLAFLLVFAMAALQGFYAIYAFIDPVAFSIVRGTDIVDFADADWVRIYASRTLFVSLVIGLLLYFKHFKILVFTALLGVVMPITDAYLAYNAGADSKVVFKHVATVLYLLVTLFVLKRVVKNSHNT